MPTGFFYGTEEKVFLYLKFHSPYAFAYERTLPKGCFCSVLKHKQNKFSTSLKTVGN